jgi:hypothetical protein
MGSAAKIGFGEDDRFEILQFLGAGAMGAVYSAFDRQSRSRVALKRLVDTTAAGVSRFKLEFRSLVDLAHPNLVSLYELFDYQEQWFFTMEYVPGWDFLEYVRPSGLSQQDICGQETLTGEYEERWSGVSGAGEAKGSLCEDRLRASILQIVKGLTALHAAGKLHCDIKPSNVRVTPGDRLVLLDFGIIRTINEDSWGHPHRVLAGTMGYMSPEQACGERLTEASDWYSVGVMLYQGLAGRLPVTGNASEVIEGKRRALIEPPSKFNPGIAPDLESLALDLLSPASQHRPNPADILARLLSPAKAICATTRVDTAVPFAGRKAQLDLMNEAVTFLGKKSAGVVFIRGTAGVGKTALLSHFAAQLQAREEVIVLAGRCREQESIPFKAVDSLLDGLVRLLQQQPREEVLRYLPRDADALCRLFVAFRTVPVFAASVGRARTTDDRQLLRRLAFGAIRELLSRLGDHYKLLLFIDDVQWGDADSASLLTELLMPSDPPALLLILTHRVASGGRGQFLQSLDRMELFESVRIWNVDVGPLTGEEAVHVAQLILRRTDRQLAEALAKESGGNPYFLHELATRDQVSVETNITSLESLLREKIRRLPLVAQHLLEVAAVFGQPIRRDHAMLAAGLAELDLDAIATLRSARLLTVTGYRASDTVEIYHDRVRETVLADLGVDARRERHLQIAHFLGQFESPDPELLAVHLEAGGNGAAAGEYYLKAGHKAAAATAFEHAARLFSRALALNASGGARDLRIDLADALANAGRSAEAARLYKQAAAHASGPLAFELARKAGYHYAISGHGDEAGTEFRKVLQDAGLFLPKSLAGTLAILVMKRCQIWLRGMNFQVRSLNEIPPAQLERLDAAQAAMTGFGLIDPIRAICFSFVSLQLALKAGEPERLVYALALTASAYSVASARGERKAGRVLETCRSLVERYPCARSRGVIALAEGIVALSTGQWRRTITSLQTAEAILSENRSGCTWELATIHYVMTLAKVTVGDYIELSRSIPDLLKQTEERGDLFLLNSLRAYVVPMLHLVADAPEAAARIVDQVENWRRDSVYLQHVVAFMSGVVVQLYSGRYLETWEYAERRWAVLKGRLQLFGANSLAYCLFTRIEAAIAAAIESEDQAYLLRVAHSDTRLLARLHPRFVTPMVLAAKAGIASVRRDEQAIDLFASAAGEFQYVDMPAMAAACRYRMGLLTGGSAGEALVSAAESALKTLGIKNQRRFASALISAAVPGGHSEART